MPGFADSFWTSDYGAGLGVLFGKLQQGVVENRQILSVARLRAEAEEVYGQRLSEIAPSVDKIQGGFYCDDGASVRKAYDGVRNEMQDAARNHKKIAQNIRDLVVNPFSRWCGAHESRIQESQDELQSRIKMHDKQAQAVKKLRNTYFNKCRLVEDLEEENKLGFQDPLTSPKSKQQIPEIKVESHNDDEVDDDDEPYEIGDETYSRDMVKKILAHILHHLKLGETKVPILGTYTNTTAGSDIVEYLQRHMDSSSVSYAERIGQDLIANGFLRLVGNVGNTFANSSRLFYQWRPKAFQMAGLPEKKAPLGRTFSLTSTGSDSADSPVVGTINEYLVNWNVLNSSRPNETPTERQYREAREADVRYKTGVRKLDDLRCDLEEAMVVHLKFLERCELDRLKAIKTVLLDFCGTISNVIPSLQSTVDKMMLFQETVQPMGDLRYLLENYRTGSFAPNVVVYENYYNKVDEQTFGVDLEARARADKKRVPIIMTTLLTYLDHHYPNLESDETRRGAWLVDVPLTQTHQLRNKINDGKPFSFEVLSEFDIPTVASVLKLYLLELPDSLVSSHVYEIIRTIYNNPTEETNDSTARISILQQTLSQLRLTNIATLDACMNHFTRHIELTSADEEYVAKLATSLAPCFLRPRTETSLTMEEKHAYRLMRDLFANKDPIFSALKRLSTLGHTGSVRGDDSQPRAISTSEHNRKTLQEERNRILVEKGGRSRAASPAPGPRSSHCRDHSQTRFPVSLRNDEHRSSFGSSNRQSLGPVLPKRTSLEVPGEASMALSHSADGHLNGLGDLSGVAAVKAPGASDDTVEKRNSLGRSAASVMSAGRVRVSVATNSSVTSLPATPPRMASPEQESYGVTLVDRLMHG